MRGSSRRRQHEDEEESAFVSMTDLTVSFLFIIMILLAWSASKISKNETVPKADFDKVEVERDALKAAKAELEKERTRLEQLSEQRRQRIEELERKIAELEKRLTEKNPLEQYLSQVASVRRQVLENLRDRLKIDMPMLQVEVSEQTDALRFKGDGLFRPGERTLATDKTIIVQKVAYRLSEILPCYTTGSLARWRDDCNEAGAIIEAVQIEGHTDSSGLPDDNVRLSSDRAVETFFVMQRAARTLVEYKNMRDQPVISIAGYGAMRPIAGNDTVEGKATNRRIDLRIIMYTPQSSAEIEIIKKRLRDGVAPVGSR